MDTFRFQISLGSSKLLCTRAFNLVKYSGEAIIWILVTWRIDFELADELIRTILNKIDKNATKLSGFPQITQNGKWITTLDGDWTGGFWVGLLWLSYKLTDEKRYAKLAYDWLRLLEKRKKDRTPDLGFLFFPSFALGYQITNDNHLKRTALEAADTLTNVFNEKANFIYDEKSTDARKVGRSAIDFMMNLQLLWWAHEETGEEKYHQIAFRHSSSTMRARRHLRGFQYPLH